MYIFVLVNRGKDFALITQLADYREKLPDLISDISLVFNYNEQREFIKSDIVAAGCMILSRCNEYLHSFNYYINTGYNIDFVKTEDGENIINNILKNYTKSISDKHFLNQTVYTNNEMDFNDFDAVFNLSKV